MQELVQEEKGKNTQSTTKKNVQQKNISKINKTGIPSEMKEKFEKKSGFSFDDVKVHYHSKSPAQFGALAYTQGNAVYIAPRQEKYLQHELGHVVQQKQGLVKPTTTVSGISLNENAELEQKADTISSCPNVPHQQPPCVQLFRPTGITKHFKNKHIVRGVEKYKVKCDCNTCKGDTHSDTTLIQCSSVELQNYFEALLQDEPETLATDLHVELPVIEIKNNKWGIPEFKNLLITIDDNGFIFHLENSTKECCPFTEITEQWKIYSAEKEEKQKKELAKREVYSKGVKMQMDKDFITKTSNLWIYEIKSVKEKKSSTKDLSITPDTATVLFEFMNGFIQLFNQLNNLNALLYPIWETVDFKAKLNLPIKTPLSKSPTNLSAGSALQCFINAHKILSHYINEHLETDISENSDLLFLEDCLVNLTILHDEANNIYKNMENIPKGESLDKLFKAEITPFLLKCIIDCSNYARARMK